MHSQKSETDDKPALKLVKNSLLIISWLLVNVGKPLYFTLSKVVIVLTYISNITGRLTFNLLNLLHSLFISTNSFNFLAKLLRSTLGNERSQKIIRFKKGVIYQAGLDEPEEKKMFIRKKPKVDIAYTLSIYSLGLQKLASKLVREIDFKPSQYTNKAVSLILKAARGKTKRISNYAKETSLALNLSVRTTEFLLKKTKLVLLGLKLKMLPSPPKLKRPKISVLKALTFTLLFIFTCSFIAGGAFWYYILKDLPSPSQLTNRKVSASTKIYDRKGVLLYNIYKDQNRTPVKLSDIPIQMRSATIAIEDSEFYNHPGFSIKGITRALIKDIKNKELTGGSTITQQLVKNTLLSSEKTLTRKLKELTLAVEVETNYSKDQILEMYLNEVSYGGTAYGVQEAARTYYNKDVENLTLGEAALLAGLPKSPTQYSPFGNNPDSAFTRQKEVLRQMLANGFITKAQMEKAENEQIQFAENKTDIKAPHFVMFVREELEKKYGKELVEQGGLEVTTTLDYQMQQLAEEIVKDEVNKLDNLHVGNGAAIVLNPTTGEILAMVGSKDYFDTKNDGNVNVTTSPRQPGSSIKVINYSYALSHGYTPATMIEDSPVSFLVEGQPPYTPKNYEGGYRGKLTLRSAFAESRNIPAVKVLASYGVNNMIEMGREMGITTWTDAKNYGLSLTLGGGEVKLVDLAIAYSTIANYGKKPDLTYILKITDQKNKIIEDFGCNNKDNIHLVAQAKASESALLKNPLSSNCDQPQVVDPRIAFMITDILKDNNARAPSFGLNSYLVIPNHPEVSVKTGTSNDLRDNLTVGYNQKYLVAVWVGNNDNSPMARIASGVTGASPIFNKIMSSLLANQESISWTAPEGLSQVAICPYTGTLACSGCPVKNEWFTNETEPTKTCQPEWFAKGDEESPTGTPAPKYTERIKVENGNNSNGNGKKRLLFFNN